MVDNKENYKFDLGVKGFNFHCMKTGACLMITSTHSE